MIDWNVLFLAGCDIPLEKDIHDKTSVETVSGVMNVSIYEIIDFKVLDILVPKFSVITYDFLSKGLTSPYDGVLGIDFFRQKGVLLIDFVEEKLWLNLKKKNK